MPNSVLLSSGSYLLCKEGWVSADMVGTSPAWGIDRFGKPALIQVSATKAGGHGSDVFVGTTGSLGVFASDSKLIQFGGKSVSISQLVESGVGEARFEGWSAWKTGPIGDRAKACIWTGLRKAAAFATDDTVVVRSRGAAKTLASGEDWLKLESKVSRRYWSVTRSGLNAALEKNWIGAFARVLDAWGQAETECYEFERSEGILALWAITALAASNERPSVAFDSLQHTCTVKVSVGSDPTATALRGGTCFVSSISSPRIHCSWDAAGWSPICNALLLGTN